MVMISLCVPDKIEKRLADEAHIAGRARSELVLEALTDFLARRERERFMTAMVAAARTLAADPEAMSESQEIADDLANDGLDSVIEAECATGVESQTKWWR
ncbi:CopG domain protein DNA-binding domain protein [Thioalkalivibrio nitratireducens DSM 14787]|uniref:CopG domain protein DNA-binding domain protein n=1 Tax=Thioalkalivibrio nitratireducens (strain DSM 14787 / UNIQEM 213 / ALEN2) TaxID=1255043 RepID=L0DZJ5_THIND|nr:CopG family transcriptional regulator [Thioalkalivibrio nitratireducens]AGA34468.1 CopG domain protein DNA-binding domain protein [Thioalkalivibrio nitratireducens DSM 14787]